MPLSDLKAAMKKRSESLYKANETLLKSQIRSNNAKTFQQTVDIVGMLASFGVQNKEANEQLRTGQKAVGIEPTKPEHFWSDYIKSPSVYEQYRSGDKLYFASDLQRLARLKAMGIDEYAGQVGVDFLSKFGKKITGILPQQPVETATGYEPKNIDDGFISNNW